MSAGNGTDPGEAVVNLYPITPSWGAGFNAAGQAVVARTKPDRRIVVPT